MWNLTLLYFLLLLENFTINWWQNASIYFLNWTNEMNTQKGKRGKKSDGQDSQSSEEEIYTPSRSQALPRKEKRKGNTKPRLAFFAQRRKGLSIAIMLSKPIWRPNDLSTHTYISRNIRMLQNLSIAIPENNRYARRRIDAYRQEQHIDVWCLLSRRIG